MQYIYIYIYIQNQQDYDELKKEEVEKKKALKQKMQSSINQRSDKSEVVFRGIVPQEYLEDDPDVAKKKVKEQRTSIKMTLSDKFANRKNPEELTKLLLQTSESNPVPQPFQPPISNGNNLESPYGGYTGALPTTPEYDEIDDPNLDDDNYDFPTFLDRLKAEKEQTSKTLELHMRRRSTMEDLQKQGILPMPNPRAQSSGDYDADASNEDIPELQDMAATQQIDDDNESEDDVFVSFIDRMKAERKKHRKSLKEMHRRRPSREDLIAKEIWKEANLDTKPQVYMSDEYANSLNKRRGSRDDGDNNNDEDSQDDMPEEDIVSSSDDSHDEYPTFLDRMREEKEQFKKQLEAKHGRRPSTQDLEKRGVVAKGYFDNMQVALTNKRKRRKSFTTELANFFQQRPDIAEMLTKGLVAAEFIGMDALEMANKRKAIKSTLNRKLNKKRRPTMDDLEMRGIVPAGYFSDAVKYILNE